MTVDNLVAEPFELADEVAGLAGGIEEALVPVRAEARAGVLSGTSGLS